MSPLAAGLAGTAIGALVVLLALWLPTILVYRQRLDDVRETFRIESGLRVTGDFALDDAAGALAQAKAAYIAIYPGRGEQPDPAWLAWVNEGGRAARGPRRRQRLAEAQPEVAPAVYDPEVIYRPQHLTVDDEPTGALAMAFDDEAIERIEPEVLQTWDAPDDRFPVWGAPPPKAPAPVGWALTWSWRDWPSVLVALMLALIPPRRRKYPWYQKVADRTWEAGVVFEVTGSRVNAAITGAAVRVTTRVAWVLADVVVATAVGAAAVRALVHPIEEG